MGMSMGMLIDKFSELSALSMVIANIGQVHVLSLM